MRKKNASTKPIPFKNSAEVIEFVREALNDRSLDLYRLAALTGVSVSWMRAFKGGRMDDPGISKIMRLLPRLGVRIEYRATGKL